MNRSKEAQYMTKADNNSLIEDLAQKASHGDCDALLALCQMSANYVLFRVMRLIPEKMDAEDTAQEILIRVCKNIGKLREPRAFRRWLNSIIINEANRALAKISKHTATIYNIDDYLDVVQEENEDFLPFEYAIREENHSILTKIVDNLPKRQMEAVMLHYYEGMSISEAASVMQMTAQGVSNYLALARNKIKKALEKMDRTDSAARSMAALPLGHLLARVMEVNAGQLQLADSVWIESVMNNCTKIVFGSAAVGAAAGGASSSVSAISKVFSALSKPASIVASFIAVTAVSVGVWYGTGPRQAVAPEVAQTVQVDEGDIVFYGGDSGIEHLNPKDASISFSDDSGDFIVTGWVVTTMDEQTIILSGDGADVSMAFSELLSGGVDGEYFLTFSLKDTTGWEYRRSRSFYITPTDISNDSVMDGNVPG